MKRTNPGSVCEVVGKGYEVQTTWKCVLSTGEYLSKPARKEKVEQMTTLTRKDCWVLLGLMGAVVGVPAVLCWLGYEALLWVARSLHIL